MDLALHFTSVLQLKFTKQCQGGFVAGVGTSGAATSCRLQKFVLESCPNKLQRERAWRQRAGRSWTPSENAGWFTAWEIKVAWEPVQSVQSVGAEGAPNKQTRPPRNVLNSSLLPFPDPVSAWCSLYALAAPWLQSSL